MVQLIPVDHDPFGEMPVRPAIHLIPVDHDPFAAVDAGQPSIEGPPPDYASRVGKLAFDASGLPRSSRIEDRRGQTDPALQDLADFFGPQRMDRGAPSLPDMRNEPPVPIPAPRPQSAPR
jgi:hypothetical protein